MGAKKDSTIYDVAIYCRLSKEDLKEDGDRDESASIGTQERICQGDFHPKDESPR